MTNSQLLFVVILIQQGLFALLWAMAARLRLARRPVRHWAYATGAATLAMALFLLRGQASDWLTIGLANLAAVTAFLALRRGVQCFVRRPPTDREHAAVLALAAIGLTAALASGTNLLGVVTVTAATMGWTLLRTAFEVRSGLAGEFGARVAQWCAWPPAVVGTLLALRGALAPLWREQLAVGIHGAAASSTGLVFAFMVFGLVLNTTLLAMVVYRLVRRLQFQSDHDVLTGLLGRRPMERRIQEEAARGRRNGTPYALLSIDIDHFKGINDGYGHAVGDAVLTRVARALRDAARAEDSVARMGGEEFWALLPGVDLASAQAAAERLRLCVRGLAHPDTDPPLRVSVSIGVAASERADEPAASLLRRLDRALYAAKAAGRDCVRLARHGDDTLPAAVAAPTPPVESSVREAPIPG